MYGGGGAGVIVYMCVGGAGVSVCMGGIVQGWECVWGGWCRGDCVHGGDGAGVLCMRERWCLKKMIF